MNTDGTRMAVGAPRSDTYVSISGGYLRVYQYDQTKSPAWQQMGQDIPGDSGYESRGRMVSMSGDGTKVASIGFDSTMGFVKVHEWSGASQNWTAMPGLPSSSEWQNHYAVAISSDGMRVAFVKQYTMGSNALFVYELGSGGTWSQVGNFIPLTWSSGGYTMALSANGIRVVVGSPQEGLVQVYDLNSANLWEQVGQSISIQGDNKFGTSVAISADGTRLVAGAPGSVGGVFGTFSSSEPYARAYTLNSGSWEQLGSDVKMGQPAKNHLGTSFPYLFGSSVDLSLIHI